MKGLTPRRGALWIIDVSAALTNPSAAVLTTVSEVGSEPYLVDVMK